MLLTWFTAGSPELGEPMPFTRSGGIAPIDESGDPARFLVSGGDPAVPAGHLVVVQLTDQPQRAITTEPPVTLGGIDPVRVCWASETIFLIDGAGTRIMAAPWDGSSAQPTSFTEVIDKDDYWPLLIGGMLDLHPADRSGVLVQRFGGGIGDGRHCGRRHVHCRLGDGDGDVRLGAVPQSRFLGAFGDGYLMDSGSSSRSQMSASRSVLVATTSATSGRAQ